LGSYDYLIGMDWFEKHHVILNYYNKEFTCLDEEGKQRKIQGIPRPISIKEVSSMQLKKSLRKGCHIYVMHIEEETKYKIPSIENHPILKDYEDVFGEIMGLPPNKDIDFSIYLISRVSQYPRLLIG